MKIYILLLLFAGIISCRQNSSTTEHFDILFIPGFKETYIQVNCQTLIDDWATHTSRPDTNIIDHNSFELIKRFMTKNHQNDTSKACNSRLLIRLDSISLCIGTDTCVSNLKGHIINRDMRVLYLIKCISGYYNYIQVEDLKNLPEIKIFGIPKNYRFNRTPPNVPKNDIIRVVLKEGD